MTSPLPVGRPSAGDVDHLKAAASRLPRGAATSQLFARGDRFAQRLVGLTGHLDEGAQERVAARQLEQHLILGIAGGTAGDDDGIVRREDERAHRPAGTGHVFDDALARRLTSLDRDGHPVRVATRRRLDEGARERAQEGLVETEHRGRLLVGRAGADLERRPERGAAAEIVDRGKVEVDGVDRQRRRHGAAAQKGEARLRAREQEHRARLEVAVGKCIRRMRHGLWLLARRTRHRQRCPPPSCPPSPPCSAKPWSPWSQPP